LKKLSFLIAALVVTYVFAGAASPFSGQWEGSIELAPSALIFGDFVSDITLELTLDYTLYGWEFGSESTFGLAGWTEQEFSAFGNLGGFTLDATIAFDPLIVSTVVYTLADGVTYQTQSVTGVNTSGDSTAWKKSIWNCDTYDEKVAYGSAAFSSLQASAQVFFAGVNLDGLCYLKGNDFEAKTVSGKWVYGIRLASRESSSPSRG